MLNSRDPIDEFLIDVRNRINPNLWIKLKKEIDKLRANKQYQPLSALSEIENLMLEADIYLKVDLFGLIRQAKEDLPLDLFDGLLLLIHELKGRYFYSPL